MRRRKRRTATNPQTEYSHQNNGLTNDYSFQAYESNPHFSPYVVQPKLKIGQPNDKYEQEADTMADKVMRMPDDTIQRAAKPKIEEEEKIQKKAVDKPLKEEEEMMQMKTAGKGKVPKEEEELLQTKPIMMKSEGGESVASPTLATQLNSTKGGGKPLAPNVNASMSNAFGTDFSHVRVHTDTHATQMNQDLHAKAFTHGSDIYFNQGQYAPTSSQGKRLLAHELTHVVQQKSTKIQRKENTVKSDLLKQVESAISTNSVTVAIYSSVPGIEKEFKRAAESFAEDNKSFGLNSEGQLIVGKSAAISVQSTGEIVEAIQNTISQIRMLSGNNNVTINNLALFAHGINAKNGRSYFNLKKGHQITNTEQQGHGKATDQLPMNDFANQINLSLGNKAKVVFYACELGDSFYKGSKEAWQDESSGGTDSFSAEFRDALNADGQQREVWGHRTTGHTTGNPTWRKFGGEKETKAKNLFGEEELAKDYRNPENDKERKEAHKEALKLSKSNTKLAHSFVKEMATYLLQCDLSGEIKRELQKMKERGVRAWVARELPYAPTPFTEGDPSQIRQEVKTFFKARAAAQMGGRANTAITKELAKYLLKNLRRKINPAINEKKYGRRLKILKGWITEELENAPAPFMDGDPPKIRQELKYFFVSEIITQIASGEFSLYVGRKKGE